MCLSLLQGDLQTADFGFEAGYMADCADSNATKFVSATTCFDEFARVFIGRTTLFTLFCCLFPCSVGASHSRSDACH
jgi:hypothetical protein